MQLNDWSFFVFATGYQFFSDFDDDGFIGSEDIKEIINRLTGNEKLKETDIELLIEDVSYPTSKPFK